MCVCVSGGIQPPGYCHLELDWWLSLDLGRETGPRYGAEASVLGLGLAGELFPPAGARTLNCTAPSSGKTAPQLLEKL